MVRLCAHTMFSGWADDLPDIRAGGCFCRDLLVKAYRGDLRATAECICTACVFVPSLACLSCTYLLYMWYFKTFNRGFAAPAPKIEFWPVLRPFRAGRQTVRGHVRARARVLRN